MPENKRPGRKRQDEIASLRKRVDELEAALRLQAAASSHLAQNQVMDNPLIQSMQEGFACCQMVYDASGAPQDFIYLAVNRAFETLTGLVDVVGKPVSQVVPGIREAAPHLMELYGRVARTGQPDSLEILFTPLNIWLTIHVYCPQPGYFVAIFENITERKRLEAKHRESETNLSALIENTDGMIWSIDRNYRLITGNRLYHASTSGFLGRTFETGESVLQPVFSKDSLEEWRARYDRALNGETFRVETLTRLQQKPEWIEFFLSPIRDGAGEITGVTIFGRNINAHKEIQQALLVSLEKYRVLFESFPLGISITNPQGEIIETNRQAEILLGLPRAEHTSRTYYSDDWRIIRPDKTPMPVEEYASAQAMKERRLISNVEMGIVKEDDQVTWLSVNAAPIPLDGFGVAITYGDITGRKKAQEALANSLEEKEALLRELNHRTKNNMQVIFAMLSLKAAETDQPAVAETYAEMVARINTMALVHQKLYESNNLAQINLREYVKDLTDLLFSNLVIGADRIKLRLDVDNFAVSIDAAAPIGMILNELISNAFKHAFPDHQAGEIRVELHQEPDGTIQLEVADDGVGFRPGFAPEVEGSMGLQSILAISRLQLQGSVEFKNSHGVACRVRFKNLPPAGR